MPKDDHTYVGHMLDAARKAVELVRGKTRASLNEDEVLLLALTHLIQIIGEAARKVSDDYQKQHPGVAWREIIGMRNKVVHDYLDLDPDVVWTVASAELEPLIKQLETL